MIETIVRYLHEAHVPFKLTCFPSEEPAPKVAYRIPKNGVLLESELVLAGARPTLVCYPSGERPDYAALDAALGVVCTTATNDALPEQIRRETGTVPPFGQLFGIPIVLDARIAEHATLVFRIFGQPDFLELPYADFARLEQPRLASFASMGELPAAVVAPPAH
jgi:Ala-tRNA(Pro) deacylase